MTVKEVDFRSDRAETAKAILRQCVDQALEHFDKEFTGFALVTWDERGEPHTAFLTDNGPVGRGMMPAYVKDALNRHIAVTVSQELVSTIVDGS